MFKQAYADDNFLIQLQVNPSMHHLSRDFFITQMVWDTKEGKEGRKQVPTWFTVSSG